MCLLSRQPQGKVKIQLERHLCDTAWPPSREAGGADGGGNGPSEGGGMLTADDGEAKGRGGGGNVGKLG